MIKNLISIEERKNIKEVEKKLDRLLEITQCFKCKEKKPLSEFAEDKNGYLGFSSICQVCSNKMDYPHTLCKCKKCGELKEYKDFYILRRDGYYEICIKCTKAMISEMALTGRTKKCHDCGEIKPASNQYFDVSVTSKDFLKRVCKVCCNKRKRQSNKSRLKK